jgi:hypothetical protein
MVIVGFLCFEVFLFGKIERLAMLVLSMMIMCEMCY